VSFSVGGRLRVHDRFEELLEAGTWTAKYRADDGTIHEVATGCRDRQAAQNILNELERRLLSLCPEISVQRG